MRVELLKQLQVVLTETRHGLLDRVRGIQKELLASYSVMLKPGGRLVYATCSILPSENRAAVDSLLETGRFDLLDEQPVSPAATGFDGFYAAALVSKRA